MSITFLWLLALPFGAAFQPVNACQNIIVGSQPVEEVQICPAPVTIYVTEDADGWHIQVWGSATANSTEPLIAATIPDDDLAPESTTLLDSASSGGVRALLYRLDTGEYEVLAGPDSAGQMYDLVFSLPPNGQEIRQDFIIAE